MTDNNKKTLKELQQDSNRIKIINRVFHDWDADAYEDEHPEIYELERASWKELMSGMLAPIMEKKDLRLLDIGTGNGFVLDVISPFITASQTVIFSDISEKMIGVVTEKFKAQPYKKEFIVCEAARVPLPDNSIDIITVNSVLHHIPNYDEFLIEARRLLAPGGALIIKHEPNIRFPQNSMLRSFYLSLNKIKGKGSHAVAHPIDSELVNALKQAGIEFAEPVSKYQLQALIDIGSPAAGGGMDVERGFDPSKIVAEVFPSAKDSRITSYAYLGKYNEQKNAATKLLSGFFKLLFPKDGYLFDLIVIK